MAQTTIQGLLCALLFVSGVQSWSVTHEEEKKVLDSLLKDYDSRIKATTPTYVYVSYMPMSLNSLDIGNQQISLTGVVTLAWHDPRLFWNPADHEGISELMVPYDAVWKPNVVVENSVDKILVIGQEEKLQVRVLNSSTVIMSTPLTLHSFCKMKILAFPFDTQSCYMQFNAWGVHDGELVMIYDEEEAGWRDVYQQNGEWDLLNHFKFTERYYEAGRDRTYTTLNLGFTFRRKWVFLTLTLIVPAILNSLLMSAVFALPFESGEKMSYALTVLLTYIVLLTLVADSLPPISIEISVLQIYLTGVMCTGTVATLLTCWTVTIYNKSPDIPRPRLLVTIVQGLSAILCSSKCCRPRKLQPSQHTNNVYSNLPNDGLLHNHSPKPEMRPNEINSNGGVPLQNGKASLFYLYNGRLNGDFMSSHSRKMFLPEDRATRNSNVYKLDDLDVYLTKSTASQSNHSSKPFDQSSHQKHSKENEEEAAQTDDVESVTWMRLAEMVDAICLRVISFIILCGTIGLAIFFGVVY